MKKLTFRAGHRPASAKPGRVAWRGMILTLLMALAAPEAKVAAAERGSVTNLPLPRYVSIKSSEVNVRRGPSLTHRIDWVFTRENMPVEITAEHGHWRRVRDREGAGGWVHYSLLSGTRTVIVDQDMLALHNRPDTTAMTTAKLEQGVVARLDSCTQDWCRLSVGGFRGWAPKTALWGVKPDEIRD